MPEAFDNCRANGGKIRTLSGPNKKYGLKRGEYRHVCILKGKLHFGEKKTKKK
jgi:hypothetical protein